MEPEEKNSVKELQNGVEQLRINGELHNSKKNEPVQKYFITDVPDWVKKEDNSGLLAIGVSKGKALEVEKAGKGLCFLYREVLNTSNEKNEDYVLRLWSLNTADVLQGASIMEFSVRDNEYINIHRVLVIRNGEVIDKIKDLNVRVFDDEQSSSSGSINKTKKINCFVNDLRLGDIFVQEYSAVTIFGEKNFLDKKFFKFNLSLPTGFWFYSQYSFKLLQNREEKIKARRRYFRDGDGVKIPEAISLIEKGQVYEFTESDLQHVSDDNLFNPYVEIATDASWEEICRYIYSNYLDALSISNIKELEQYKDLKLNEDKVHLEEDIQTIIEYVQNQIIYLFDAEVMHGHIPELPEKTMTSKSGDCKAKSLLLVDLLNAIGVKSEFVLVNFSYDYFLTESMPSPFLFNHAIVKINHNGKDYFVDPTVSDKYGILEKRAEPLFSSYLPVDGKSSLMTKKQQPGAGFNIEKSITLILKKDIGLLRSEVLYRRESADIMRKNFNKFDVKEGIKNETENFFSTMCYPKEKDMDKLFTEVKFELLSDDKKENCLKVSYQSKLINPYHPYAKGKIIKFWFGLGSANIRNYKHKDHLCDSFCGYPIKYDLKIESDLFVNSSEDIVKRDTKIDNDYFSFSNIKSISAKGVVVSSEYLPKTYDFIKAEDLEKIKDDFIKIDKDNFGVGVIFLNLWQYIVKKPYAIVIVYVLIVLLVRLIMAATNSQF